MTKVKQIPFSIFLLILLSFCIHLNSTAQNTNKEAKALKKQEQYEVLQNLVNNEQYHFTAGKARPQKGGQIDLTTSPNYLTIDNGHARASLPYFGRAFTGSYGRDGGIKFDGSMENYDVNKNEKKQKMVIKFRVKGPGDTYKCTLTAYGIETATLSIISNNRQQISYIGAVSGIDKDK